mgnify:FL=1|jgi:hypothetical protein
MKKILNFLCSLVNSKGSVGTFSHTELAYLNKATDVGDLEHRMRQLERERVRGFYA